MIDNKPIIDIDINDIFYQLHTIALEQVKSTDYDIINLGVSTADQTYVGSGDFLIMAKRKGTEKWLSDIVNDIRKSDTDINISELSGEIRKNVEEKIKKNCYSAIKTYVEFFTGKDIADKIKEDDLVAIDKNITLPTLSAAESIDYSRSLYDNVFCEASDQETKDQTDRQVMMPIGYSLQYEAQIAGFKKHDLADRIKKEAKSAKNIMASVLGSCLKGTVSLGKAIASSGLMKDLLNIKFKVGGHQLGLSHDTLSKAATKISDMSKKSYKAIADKLKVEFKKKDLVTVKNDLVQQLDKDFPNNIADTYVFKTEQLVSNLRQQKLLTADIQKMLMSSTTVEKVKFINMEYCIGIVVSNEDENYSDYTQKTLAATVTKSFGHADNPFLKNGVSEKDIIKIKDYQIRFKTAQYKDDSRKTKIESLDQHASRLLKVIFESWTDNVIEEAKVSNEQLIRLFLTDGDVDMQKKSLIVKNLNKSSLKDDDVSLKSSFKTKQDLCDAIDLANTEDELSKIFSHYMSGQEDKLKNIYDNMKKTADYYDEQQKDNNTKDSVRDLYIVVKHNISLKDKKDSNNAEQEK